MFRLAQSWVWAFWLVDDGSTYHVFFLQAPRSLGRADLRHFSATVGHAVSSDLITWEAVEDAVAPSRLPAFDDRAVWTGSTVAGPDGRWHLFYTGVSNAENGLVQRVGSVVSDDLYRWERPQAGPLVVADPRWYEALDTRKWPHEAWRDPWVFRDPKGNGWHMLLTARANYGELRERGVVGHATSADLATWQVEPPLSRPGCGFGQLEDLQAEVIEGRSMLLFACHKAEIAQRISGSGGIWAVHRTSVGKEWQVEKAHQLTDDLLYCGRAMRDRSGRWVMLAFHNASEEGFVGEISDPMPLTFSGGDKLMLSSRGGTRPRSSREGRVQ